MEDITKEIPQVIQDSVQKIIENQKFQIHKEVITHITTEDNNFLGELYEIEITGETEDGYKEMNIFLKHIINNEDFKLCSIPAVYKKEAFVYLELSKMLQRLQDDASIPEVDRFNMVKNYDETNSECIILDNLAVAGYKTVPRGEVMSVEFAQEAISQLAKFHGLSFVIEKKYPDYFDLKIKSLQGSCTFDEHWDSFVQKISNVAISKFEDEIKCRLVKFLEMASEKYPKYMNGLTSTLKCLCHGDYKMNNLLHKKENGRITHLVPIDFQHVYYGCPIMDFLYLIYAASDGDFRDHNLYPLRDHYYETLTSFLEYFDIDFGNICSKTEFDKIFDDSREYALMFSLYLLPLFYVVDEKPSAKDNILELALKVDDTFHNRIEEIVDEFIRWNII